MERREIGGRVTYRVRYRHEGRNMAVSFVTEARAKEWRHLLDTFGHDVARQAFRTDAPDLSDFGSSIVPKPGARIDPFGCFVYFLWADSRDRPVYVGATTNLPKRLWHHAREKQGLWSTYSLIRCKDEATMWRLESRLIGHYRPELNLVQGRAS